MTQAAYYERNETIRIGEGVSTTPGPCQIQIAIAYVGICGTDLHIFHGKMDRRVAKASQATA
jgi:threonine dehydrogenase-like Zn-dependent dehydrogenase